MFSGQAEQINGSAVSRIGQPLAKTYNAKFRFCGFKTLSNTFIKCLFFEIF